MPMRFPLITRQVQLAAPSGGSGVGGEFKLEQGTRPRQISGGSGKNESSYFITPPLFDAVQLLREFKEKYGVKKIEDTASEAPARRSLLSSFPDDISDPRPIWSGPRRPIGSLADDDSLSASDAVSSRFWGIRPRGVDPDPFGSGFQDPILSPRPGEMEEALAPKVETLAPRPGEMEEALAPRPGGRVVGGEKLESDGSTMDLTDALKRDFGDDVLEGDTMPFKTTRGEVMDFGKQARFAGGSVMTDATDPRSGIKTAEGDFKPNVLSDKYGRTPFGAGQSDISLATDVSQTPVPIDLMTNRSYLHTVSRRAVGASDGSAGMRDVLRPAEAAGEEAGAAAGEGALEAVGEALLV